MKTFQWNSKHTIRYHVKKVIQYAVIMIVCDVAERHRSALRVPLATALIAFETSFQDPNEFTRQIMEFIDLTLFQSSDLVMDWFSISHSRTKIRFMVVRIFFLLFYFRFAGFIYFSL